MKQELVLVTGWSRVGLLGEVENGRERFEWGNRSFSFIRDRLGCQSVLLVRSTT
jgi:hypothetical protein